MHGDPRPRGAIRASLPDWLAYSPYADQIVALRPAHISHGGAGAVYVILRRARDD
jgi:DNA-nicking Smr family endonuclease